MSGLFFSSLSKAARLTRDVAITAVNLPTLPLVLGVIPPFLKEDSEINPGSYDSSKQYGEMLYEALRLPGMPPADNYLTPDAVGEDKFPNEKWYFLNGICTNEDMWELNARALNELFDRKIHPFHNRSNGAIADIWESIKGRTFDKPSQPAKQFAAHLAEELLKDELDKIVIIAHSQGGIIASNILKYMADTFNADVLEAMVAKLELYTFASAADETPKYLHHVEHFANTVDFFTRIGSIVFSQKLKGQHFRAFKAGHLLNVHYLPDFRDGLYKDVEHDSCAKCSTLYSYIPPANR